MWAVNGGFGSFSLAVASSFSLMWRHLKHKLHYIQLKYEMGIKRWLFWEYGGWFYSVKGLFIADLRDNKREAFFLFAFFFPLAERRGDELLETRKVAGLRIFLVFQNSQTNTVDWAVLPCVVDTPSNTHTHTHTHTHPPPCWILGGATQQVRLYCIRGLLHLQPFAHHHHHGRHEPSQASPHSPLQSHLSSRVLFTWVGLHLANTLLASGGGGKKRREAAFQLFLEQWAWAPSYILSVWVRLSWYLFSST